MGLLTANSVRRRKGVLNMAASRLWRLSILVLLAAVLAPSASTAQNERSRLGPNGMVLDEDGGWRFPTSADALNLLREELVGRSAQSVLRQEFEFRPRSELDALADSLADILLAGDPEYGSQAYEIQRAAASALLTSATGVKWWIAALSEWSEDIPGTPHAGAFDALVRVYETRAARALADGGTDPFKEAYKMGSGGPGPGYSYLNEALSNVYWADPAGRGGDYLLSLLETAEPPEPEDYDDYLPTHGLWCQAAHMLRGDDWFAPLPGGRLSELPAIARNGESFLARCKRLGNMRQSRYSESLDSIVRGNPGIPPSDDSRSDAFELLREVYEVSAERALRGGGSDPLLEAARGGEDPTLLAAHLRNVFEADSVARGVDYLLVLLEASQPPEPGEPPPASQWCEVVRLLRESRWRVRLPAIARDDQSFASRCTPLDPNSSVLKMSA